MHCSTVRGHVTGYEWRESRRDRCPVNVVYGDGRLDHGHDHPCGGGNVSVEPWRPDRHVVGHRRRRLPRHARQRTGASRCFCGNRSGSNDFTEANRPLVRRCRSCSSCPLLLQVTSVNFATGVTAAVPRKTLHVTHGAMMFLTWGFALPIGVIIARFTKDFPPPAAVC